MLVLLLVTSFPLQQGIQWISMSDPRNTSTKYELYLSSKYEIIEIYLCCHGNKVSIVTKCLGFPFVLKNMCTKYEVHPSSKRKVVYISTLFHGVQPEPGKYSSSIRVPLRQNCVSASSYQYVWFFTSQISFSAFQLFSFSAFLLFCFSAFLLFCFSAFLLFCFSAFLLFCFSAFLLFCFSAFLLFCFSAFLLFCFSAFLLFCFSAFLLFSFLATKRLWHLTPRSLSHLRFSNQLPIFFLVLCSH